MKANIPVGYSTFSASFSLPSYRISSLAVANGNASSPNGVDDDWWTNPAAGVGTFSFSRVTFLHSGLTTSTHEGSPCFLSLRPSYFFVAIRRQLQSFSFDNSYITATPPDRQISLVPLTGESSQLRPVIWHNPSVRLSHRHSSSDSFYRSYLSREILTPNDSRFVPRYFFFWTIIKAGADSKFTFASTMFPTLSSPTQTKTIFEFARINAVDFVDHLVNLT